MYKMIINIEYIKLKVIYIMCGFKVFRNDNGVQFQCQFFMQVQMVFPRAPFQVRHLLAQENSIVEA